MIDNDTANHVFTSNGLEFIKLNEFAVRFHLVSLDNNVRDFMEHYNYLHGLSKLTEAELPDTEEVWDAVIVCAEAIAAIANILVPSPKTRKNKLLNKFTKLRAEALQGLLLISLGQRNELVNFRNRLHHEDEDFDEWFFNQMSKEKAKPTKLTRRKVFWGVSPININGEVFASAYDAKIGFVHFFDHHFSLHELMSIVTLINKNFSSAEDQLSKLSGKATRVATL